MFMIANNILFFVFGSFCLVFSFFVIMSKNPVHSILSLILVFFNAASLLIFLNVEFLAFLFIIVYVGAVAVLFLFVIMLLNIKVNDLNLSIYRYLPILFLFVFVFLFEFFLGFDLGLFDFRKTEDFSISIEELSFFNSWITHVVLTHNICTLGFVLYTYFFYYFILSGIILLLSMVGAIMLTLHKRNDVKKQFIYKQVQRNFGKTISWKT